MSEYSIDNIQSVAVNLFESRKLVRFDDLPAGITQDHVRQFFDWLDAGTVAARTFYIDVRHHARMRWFREKSRYDGRSAEDEAELLLASYFRGIFASWLTFENVIGGINQWEQMGGHKMKVTWAMEHKPVEERR